MKEKKMSYLKLMEEKMEKLMKIKLTEIPNLDFFLSKVLINLLIIFIYFILYQKNGGD